ncbi:MAG: hypothetical protein AB7K09_04485 [Planctomycetota bacterium]
MPVDPTPVEPDPTPVEPDPTPVEPDPAPSRELRVLLIDSDSRYETDYLLAALDAAPLIHYHAWLDSGDGSAPTSRTDSGEPLTAMPPAESDADRAAFAANWDVVILGDVPRYRLGEPFLEMLRSFVVEHGKSLILLAGSRRYMRALSGSPIEDVLPVTITSASRVAPPLPGVVRHWQLTAAGRAADALRLVPDEGENATLWQETFSGFTWFLPVDGPKPGANVLIEHPLKVAAPRNGETVEEPVTGPSGGAWPLMVQMDAGKGHSLFIGSDEFWYMRGGDGSRQHHTRMWLRTLRAVAGQQVDIDGDPAGPEDNGDNNDNGDGGGD